VTKDDGAVELERHPPSVRWRWLAGGSGDDSGWAAAGGWAQVGNEGASGRARG
jgi:hypothetical protein